MHLFPFWKRVIKIISTAQLDFKYQLALSLLSSFWKWINGHLWRGRNFYNSFSGTFFQHTWHACKYRRCKFSNEVIAQNGSLNATLMHKSSMNLTIECCRVRFCSGAYMSHPQPGIGTNCVYTRHQCGCILKSMVGTDSANFAHMSSRSEGVHF